MSGAVLLIVLVVCWALFGPSSGEVRQIDLPAFSSADMTADQAIGQ